MDLDYFDTKIRPFVEYFTLTEDLGILPGTATITDACSGCPGLIDQRCFDRFKVEIPYAGKTVTWEIIFDCTKPTEPPDFIFDISHEDFLPEMDKIESLCNWDASKPESLYLLIKELLMLLREHNFQYAVTHSRLDSDIRSLLLQGKLEKEDFEVLAPKTENQLGSVSIAARLNVDFSQLPAFLVKGNPGPDRAVLCLSYPSPESSWITPELFVSSRVHHALGGTSQLKIPPLVSGTLIGDYLITVQNWLDEKVTEVVRCAEKKKEYVAAFLSHFGRSVIEYDLETFSSISFLFEWNDFFFIFSVTLPFYFPAEQPQFLFQSVYHESKGRPYFQAERDFPYSPRWSANEMAVRAKAYILENIAKFQRASVLAKKK